MATVHGVNYLLTWNYKHLANAQIARRIARVCEEHGRTPEELMGTSIMWEDPIVAEVHRIRKEIAARYNFDMAAYFADVQRRQVARGDRLVLQPKSAEPDAADVT